MLYCQQLSTTGANGRRWPTIEESLCPMDHNRTPISAHIYIHTYTYESTTNRIRWGGHLAQSTALHCWPIYPSPPQPAPTSRYRKASQAPNSPHLCLVGKHCSVFAQGNHACIIIEIEIEIFSPPLVEQVLFLSRS